MNTDTGRIYVGNEEIRAAQERGEPLVEVDLPATLCERILSAMKGLGREPDLGKIAHHADLPVIGPKGGRQKLAPEAVAAMDDLLRRRQIVPGTRGGFRLAENA